MKKLENIDLKNKSVVIRLDYNVPIHDGIITDNSKITKSIPTLNYLLNNDCKIIILSHYGRVKSEEDKAKNSLRPVAKELANLLQKQVKFIDNCYGPKVSEFVKNSKNGEIILLENTRYMDYPKKLESGNVEALAKFWASLGDVFVNDAFGSMHRAHASTAGIAKFLPNCVGLLVENEISHLSPIIQNPVRPFTVFMGGAKVDDKLKLIKAILPKCDCLLLGGGIANSFLKAKGADVGTSIATSDAQILAEIKELAETYKKKIVLPIDFTIDDGCIYDIGIKSIDLYKKYINASKTIFVNGTSGKFEDERFVEGTEGLFRALKESSATVVVGGGDTASAIKKFGYEEAFDFVSSGGGATLEYLADGKLEALEWMEK
ncbi:MAG: phosphoglycerate kinase [Bacilli bacterium]|nr:phosphoglycerate kinase [Bacilli bacterium]